MKKYSIGNDIVALEATNSARTCQPRFYSKFLTTTETGLFEKAKPVITQEGFIWLCWSIKESVYKFQQRLQPQLAFAAGKISIKEINAPLQQRSLDTNFLIESNSLQAENCFTSVAVINSIPLYSYSFITGHFIYTITANKENCNNLHWGIKKIDEVNYNNQSLSVRQFASQKLSGVLNTDAFKILKDTAGIPYLQQHPQIPVSFTHHHHFVAYAFLA